MWSRALPGGVQEVVAERRSWRERSRRLWGLLRALDSGPLAKWAARAMVCAWYINQVRAAQWAWRVGCGRGPAHAYGVMYSVVLQGGVLKSRSTVH